MRRRQSSESIRTIGTGFNVQTSMAVRGIAVLLHVGARDPYLSIHDFDIVVSSSAGRVHSLGMNAFRVSDISLDIIKVLVRIGESFNIALSEPSVIVSFPGIPCTANSDF